MWAKFDDQYPENRKLRVASEHVLVLHFLSILRASFLESDGRLTASDLGIVFEQSKIPRAKRAEALKDAVAARLIEEVDGGYLVHDFLDYNPSHEELEAKRRTGAKRLAGWRRNGRRNVAGNTSGNSGSNGVTGTVTNGNGNGVGNERPDPVSLSLGSGNSSYLGNPGSDARDPSATTPTTAPHTAHDWLVFFSARHREKTGRFYGQGEADARAVARLGDLFAGAPETQLSADWAARERIVGEFLASNDPATVKVGWSFAFFAAQFQGLAIPPEQRPAISKPGRRQPAAPMGIREVLAMEGNDRE